MPGSYPSSYAVEEIVNFDQKTFCDEIGREAWGRIDFAAQLPEGEAEKWDLTPAGLKMFWLVLLAADDLALAVLINAVETSVALAISGLPRRSASRPRRRASRFATATAPSAPWCSTPSTS